MTHSNYSIFDQIGYSKTLIEMRQYCSIIGQPSKTSIC